MSGPGPDVSPQSPPPAAQTVFGANFDRAQAYAALLCGPGVTRGLVGPREPERIWTRHLLNGAALAPFTDPAHASLATGVGNLGAIYGSTFFMATGFHGFHVIVGTIFLIVCLGRAIAGQFTPTRHFGFEAAAWYWHFVDVVWLFLFVWVYWWGGSLSFTTTPVGGG